MQPQRTSPDTAHLSALLQQLLLAQGGRYASTVREEDWKESAVLMLLPPGPDPGRRLPDGRYLVLPWDVGEAAHLEAWLGSLFEAGMRPEYTVLITSMAHVSPDYLLALGLRFGTHIAAVQSQTGGLVGHPGLTRHLSVLFEPEFEESLAWVNPLQHMVSLGDPRDPRVFSERLRRASPRAWVTWTLLVANALVYLAMVAEVGMSDFTVAQFMRYGANFAALTVGDGQWWRLISCTFVHGGLLHLAFNLYALKVLGETAERLFGAPMFTAVYLLSGIGGSLASLGWTLRATPETFSVGASGAVFGIMGGLLGYALARRGSVPVRVFKGLTRSALMFIGINITIGLSIAFIDNAAHIGGLIVGTLAGAVLSRDLPPAPQPTAVRRALAIGGLCVALALAWQVAAGSIDEDAIASGMRFLHERL